MKIHSSSCCSPEPKSRWNWRVVLLASTAVVVLVVAILGFFAQ